MYLLTFGVTRPPPLTRRSGRLATPRPQRVSVAIEMSARLFYVVHAAACHLSPLTSVMGEFEDLAEFAAAAARDWNSLASLLQQGSAAGVS